MDNNTTGGAISFEMLVETGQLDRASEESIKRIKGISRESVAAGKAVDEFFGATTDNVKIQKDVISELEKRYSSLQKEIDRLAPGRAQAELRKEAIIVRAELDAEKNTLNELEASVKKNSVAHASFRTQLRYAKDALVEMEMAGKRGTEEYRIKQQELARLTDAMNDAQAQANILAHDQGGFQGVISAISGVAGGFSAAQGAMGLFAGENENLQRIMLKVQSLMAVTIGLQQIQQTLNKDSAFMLKTVTKAKDLYASATNRLSVALGLSNVAAKALMATLTLGLSVAIGGAIYLTEKYISKQREAARKQQELSKAISDEAYKAVSAIESLSSKYKSFGDNLKSKEKFIRDNADAFDDLGVTVRGVKDAENLLINNKDKFVEAQIQKAKALAATQIAAEKFKELIQTELKIQETPKTILTGTQRGFGPQPQSQQEIKTPALIKLEEEKKGIELEIQSLYEISDLADSTAKKIIKSIGGSGERILEGSVLSVEKSLSELNQRYKEAASDPERRVIAEQIKAEEAKLLSLQIERNNSTKDPFSEQLEKRKKLYQDYFNWINSNRPDLTEGARKEFEDLLKGGNSFMDYLEKQAMELEGKRGTTDNQKKQLKAIRDYIANEVKTTALDTFEKELTAKLEAAKTTLEKMSILDQSKPGGTTELDKAKQDFINSEKEKTIREERALTQELLANYAGYLQEKIQFNESYAENKRLLNLAFEKAENDDAKKIALEALTELERQKEQFNNKSGNKDYDELIDRYKSFKQQLDDLVADFDRQIELALKNGNKDLADTISNAKEDELKRFVKGFSKTEVTGYIEELKRALSINLAIFASTGQQSDKLFEIKKLIEDIKTGEAYRKLAGQINEIGKKEAEGLLNVLEAQLKKLDEQSEVYSEIKNLINNTRTALKSQTVEDINKAADGLREMARFAGLFDEELANALDGLSQLATGIAQFSSGNYFQGIFQIITAVFSTILNASENAARKAEETQQRLLDDLRERLSDINILLEKQISLIDKLSGSDRMRAYSDSFRTLRDEIIGTLNQINKLEVTRKGYRGAENVNLDELIKTYRELFGNVRPGTGLPDIELIERLIDENRQAIDELYGELLRGDIDGNNAEELRLLIEQLESNTEQYEELRNRYNEYITGTTADSIIDSIISGFEDGKFAAKDFADTFEDLMKNAMLQAVKMKYLEGPLQEWYETFAAYSEDGLTPEEIAALREAYNTIIESAAAEAQNIQSITGSEAGTDNSLSGAIKGVTEQTAGLIAGQMNAIRMNQAQALMLMDDQLAHLSEIASNTRYNKLLVDIKNLLQSSSSNSSNSNRAAGGN